ncbi:hypothetical protein RchiOBHm_Chr6g0258541 [Rosa chinensis]|uniref:Uncharacterized protein n=1 Tax=Rosa chinensis TaxID=74649 RepID=A0A2P6PMP7_ROSCH|nr:hypothetical protein RchiOBHm_Chr6g0258541 [Rosa chinensis]
MFNLIATFATSFTFFSYQTECLGIEMLSIQKSKGSRISMKPDSKLSRMKDPQISTWWKLI